MSLTRSSSKKLNKRLVQRIVRQALQEDKARQDITSQCLIPSTQKAKGVILAKEAGVLAGIELAKAVFRALPGRVKVTVLKKDGSRFKKGAKLVRLAGPARAILAGERTVLNFLQHLSGIATLTAQYVQKLRGTKASLLDTRKTLPGLRALEKYAVLLGGGENHRLDLADMVLIKENHLAGFRGSLAEKLKELRKRYPGKKIEIEADSLAKVKKFSALKVDLIMLDNLGLPAIKAAVRLIRRKSSRIGIEVSGGVNLGNIRQIAQAGADHISVGRLTHSPKALDLSLLLE